MLAIIKTNKYEEVTKRVKANGGFCPCIVGRHIFSKCPCDEFVESEEVGVCRCGRFERVKFVKVKE